MNKNILNNQIPQMIPGRGFGNLDISNQVRIGNPSRIDNNLHKEYLESNVTFNYQIDYHNNSNNIENKSFTKNTYTPLFINHDNNMLNRIGENTRKQNQLNVDVFRTPINPNNNDNSFNNNLSFDYS